MNDIELRLECLRLAISIYPAEEVKRSQEYYEFVTNTGDSKIIEAARNLAQVVKNNG